MQLAHSTEPTPGAPVAWAARLIERLHALYGAKFTQQWDGIDPARLAQIWAEELAGYTAEEIGRGLTACRARVFPPTLPEFLLLCRPTLNPEAAYHEAVAGMSARSRGEMGAWSHPGIYWAAVRVTQHDLLSMGWQAIRGRWELALRDVMSAGKWEPVPAPAIALTAPNRTRTSLEESQRFMRTIKEKLGLNPMAKQPERDHKAWAFKLLNDPNPTIRAMAERAVAAAKEQA